MKEKTVYKIREFNRLYMPIFNLLGNSYLGSEYSPTEARVLFEIYENNGCNAAYIAQKMNIDKSYLSRIIKNHIKHDYITRSTSQTDSRAYNLYLTEKGIKKTEDFISKANSQIMNVIGSLDDEACKKLTDALDTIVYTLQNIQ